MSPAPTPKWPARLAPSALIALVLASASPLAPAEPRQPAKSTKPAITAAEALATRAIELSLPGKEDALDFTAVGRLIGDARVVLLGEPWHGDGGAIALRSQLVRYLHESKGFDVLVFEADFFALHEAWEEARRGGGLEGVKSQIYPFWTGTRAAAPLWKYLEESLRQGRPLAVAGIDTKLVGPRSLKDLPSALRGWMAAVPGIDASAAQRTAATLDAALTPREETKGLLTTEGFQELEQTLILAERHFGDRHAGLPQPAPDRAEERAREAFRAQVVSSLRRNIQGERRDTGMAANLIWLAERQYPGEKLIVWAHNNHIVSDKWMILDGTHLDGLPQSDEGRAATSYLGDEVRRAFGSRALAIATTVYQGRFSPNIEPALGGLESIDTSIFDVAATLAPAPAGTVEAALAGAGHRTALIDLRTAIGSPAVSSRVLDYTALPPVSMELWRGFDALLFLRTTRALNDPPGSAGGEPKR